MLHFTFLMRSVASLMISLMILSMPVRGQITTSCTSSMVTSFTPCFNFFTNSTLNGTTSPTSDCCDSIKSLASTAIDCLCLLVTANVPLQLPSLALALPSACNMPGVPLQCKASSSPLPAPGPGSSTPALSPGVDQSANSGGSSVAAPISTLAPESSTPPSLNATSQPALTPSSTAPSCSFPPLVLLLGLGALIVRNY